MRKAEVPSYVPDFDPLEEGVVRCERCDQPVEISDYYIYKGETLCGDCISDLEREVATRVK